MAGGAGRVIRTNKNIAKQKAKKEAVKQAKRSSASQSGSSGTRKQSTVEIPRTGQTKAQQRQEQERLIEEGRLRQQARGQEKAGRAEEKRKKKEAVQRKEDAQRKQEEAAQREREQAQNKRNLDNVNRYSKEMNKNKAKESGPSFTSTGQQGLDKIRFHESRGANLSDQQRINALSGDMRRNFSEQGGINRVGVSALRGAVVGGVAGGGIESMQGGDFWDGAKSGAFYGATGMAGVRATRQAVGAQSYIGKNGIMGTMKMNKEAYGVGVKDLMLNQQNVGRAKDVMNSTRKK